MGGRPCGSSGRIISGLLGSYGFEDGRGISRAVATDDISIDLLYGWSANSISAVKTPYATLDPTGPS